MKIQLREISLAAGYAFLAATCPPLLATAQEVPRANILFISIDDLNADVGFLGDTTARTPNMDRLAGQSAVFANAHVQAPICGPSRNSLLTGMYPHSTGLYSLNPMFRDVEGLADLVALPQLFRENGYRTMATGKVYHSKPDPLSFDRTTGWFGGFGPFPDEPLNLDPDLPVHPFYDWGPFLSEGETSDYQVAKAAATWIREAAGSGEPFFIAAGFFRPHCPLYAPEEWFDLHPIEAIPPITDQSEDLNDISPYARKLVSYYGRQKYSEWLREGNRSASFLQAYRASVSFTDHCVGLLLEALRESGQEANTIIVLFSDHGVQNGQKNLWYKRTLWEASTRVPLLIKLPGKPARRIEAPVGLIDIYPTLCEVSGLKPAQELEGLSLIGLIEGRPGADERPPALTSHGPGNFAVRDQRWRYIRYADGSEELYDHVTDPLEQINLAGDPAHAEVIDRMASALPTQSAPFAPGSEGMGSSAFPGK